MKSIQEKFDQTLDYIYSFINHSMTRQKILNAEEYNLTRMRKLMMLLGNPQDTYPTIHVTGTKGKGSVSAFLASTLQTQGYKTGLYTSPHLINFEERVQINFTPIDKNLLIELINKMKPAIAQFNQISTFEIITALGFLAFAHQNVDIAIIEVGLGGRLDATNIITPILSVITTLAIDHTNYLGNTIEKIASEKAGIIKPNIPIILAEQEYKETIQIVKNIAEKNNAPFIDLNLAYQIEIIERNTKYQKFIVKAENETLGFQIKMLGDFQTNNCLTAYYALKLFAEFHHLSDDSIQKGLSNAFWKGRFEVLSENPIILIDSAHNPYAIKKLNQSLQNYFPNKKYCLIFGVSEDKNYEKMIMQISEHTSLLIASQSNHPRALAQQKIQQIAKKHDINNLFSKDATHALQLALKNIKFDEIIICTGSIFMAASLRAAYEENINDLLTES